MIIKLYEKFIDLKEVKDEILLKAIDTDKLDIVDFFIKKGYDINAKNAIEKASYDDEMFRYFLKHKANPEDIKYDSRRMMDLDVQKALIDFGYDDFINDNAKFNYKLKEDPKYAEVIDRFEEMKKYNL